MNTFQPDADMLRDYIQRKLGPQEEERVELWLADHPEIVNDLELDLALQESMRDVNPNVPETPRAELPRWLGWLTRPVPTGATAFALLAAIVTPTALLIASHQRENELQERITALAKPVSNPHVFLLANKRSGYNDAHATFASESAILIQAVVRRSSNDFYEARVLMGNREVFQISDLKAVNDIVSFYLPEGALPPGNYQIEIGGSEAQPEITYQIKVE